MKLENDAEFQLELREYSLCCSCEKCIHYNGFNKGCSLYWPNGNHREQSFVEHPLIIFCKDYEMR
ncbi:hypothetical protein KKF34_03890 [Myxococcota bacterium]|nr:hypothetical protein [Myxococcota bacterium]MBU1495997.1 hypothetical protein [Myxococcota bacterium]